MIPENMEVGKTYEIRHSRKGRFEVKIEAHRGEWIDAVISHGKAGAMLDYNEKEAGEDITLRASFVTVLREIT